MNEGFIVGFSCGVRTRDDSIERVTIYVNTSPSAPMDEHTVELVDASGRRLTAWAYPQDPALPSLPAVSYITSQPPSAFRPMSVTATAPATSTNIWSISV